MLREAALFALSVFLYHSIGAGWVTFAALFLWPDLFMAGYLVNMKVGASLYDFIHTEALPVALGGVHQSALLAVAIIWLAHAGLDRALGYGLKYL